ncbi:MAG TPA: hypothetical protein VEU31_09385 [Candidatus Acidoferrales bacterium]|nr:hypothetical protein [Candidatus Acidoferrales bacterium]
MTTSVPQESPQKVQTRVEWLIVSIGAAGALLVAVRWNLRSAAGFALGAALSWLNYRWLRKGVATIVPAPAIPPCPPSEGEEREETPQAPPRGTKRAFAKFFARAVLLLGTLYAILSYSLLPAAPFLAGLFAMVAAVMAELLYELMWHKW